MNERELALARCLSALTEDLVFATISSDNADLAVWKELVKRRADAYGDILRGRPQPGPQALDPWLFAMVRAMVPVQAPSWLPMRALIDGGVTLLSGARGVRSLFSSKPSDKDVQRVRRLGALAVKLSISVMAADGVLSIDERRVHHALVAALGLGADDEALLLATTPVDPHTIDGGPDLDPKIVKQLTAGAWQAAYQDGLDARDEGAVVAAANRLSLALPEVAAIGVQVKNESEQRRWIAGAAIESIAYLLVDDVPRVQSFARVLAEIGAPSPYRGDLWKLTTPPGPPALTHSHTDKAVKASLLSYSWLAALHANPNYVRRAALAVRHDKIAAHLGADSEGPRVRAAIESFLDGELETLARSADEQK